MNIHEGKGLVSIGSLNSCHGSSNDIFFQTQCQIELKLDGSHSGNIEFESC